MPFHFCADELVALCAIFPFLGAFLVWVRSKLLGRAAGVTKCQCTHSSKCSENTPSTATSASSGTPAPAPLVFRATE